MPHIPARRRPPVALSAAVLGLLALTAAGADWPQWGGPTRDFKVPAPALAEQWPAEGPRTLWQREFSAGYSAIVTLRDRLFTMYRDGDDDVVVGLNATDGRTLWEYRYAAPPIKGQELAYGTGPNATPLIVGDRLITVSFTGKLHGLDLANGKAVWAHDLVAEYGGKVQEFGYSASPLLHDGHVVVLVGGERTGLMAFRPADGSVAWQSGPLDISYASPILINVDGQDQIVVMASTEVIGVVAGDRSIAWRWPCENEYKNNASPPIWGPGNRLWVTTQRSGGTRMLHLTQSGGKTTVEQVWASDKIRLFHWNAIWDGAHLYATIGDTTTLLAGIDAATGDIVWRERGLNKAKLLYADGKLIALDEDGKLALIRATPQGAQTLAECALMTQYAWTPPTLVGRTLFLRDQKRLVAVDLGK